MYGYEGEYFKPTLQELTEEEAVSMIANAGEYAKVHDSKEGYHRLYAIWFKDPWNPENVSQIYLTPKYVDKSTLDNLLYKYPTVLIYWM